MSPLFVLIGSLISFQASLVRQPDPSHAIGNRLQARSLSAFIWSCLRDHLFEDQDPYPADLFFFLGFDFLNEDVQCDQHLPN